jgi:hypothetical protein
MSNVTGASESAPIQAALQVVAANAAPVLDAAQSPTLTSVSAGAAAPVNGNTTAGDLVSTLVGGITDADADGAGVAKGIAITGVRAGATLYYTTNGGTTWLTATGVSETNALLLAADSNTRVFYGTSTAGTVTDAITFRAWDMTANITEGVYTDTTPRGGKAQFSLVSDTVGIAVTAPVVLDMNRDGVLSYSQVTMDVNGDGLLDLTHWTGAQDGVLVWDKFADGLVHNNSQYAFGQYATTYHTDALGNARSATDLEGLADAFDTNRDGVFSMTDEKFGEFKVWQDIDQDGVSDAGEVRSLADVGITSINLVSDGVQRTPVEGVTEAGQTTANLADGGTMLVADALFAFNALDYNVDGQTVNLLGSHMTLDLSSIVAVHSHVTEVDLTGTGANTLKLNLADDFAQLNGAGWFDTGATVTQAGHAYEVYHSTQDSSVQVLIDQAILNAGHVL